MTDESTGPSGLGGWLILVILGLIVSPVRIAHLMATNYWPLFRDGLWAKLTTAGSAAYHPLWKPLLIFEVGGNLVCIALGLVTLVLLLMRSTRTPSWAISWYSWAAVFVLADFFLADLIPYIAAHPDPESAKELARSLFAAGVWIPYFLVSKRVQATFVR